MVENPPGAACTPPGSKPRVKATVKLAHLKFMQKAAAKAKPVAIPIAAERETPANDSAVPSGDVEQWSAADGCRGGGCRVIVEDAPPPGAPLGRFSFGAFNSTVEALQAATEAAQAAPAATAAQADVSVSISDATMAATLGGSSQEGPGGNATVTTPADSTSRAAAARKEALASMRGVAVGREQSGLRQAAASGSHYADDGSGLLSLLPTAARPEKLSQPRGGKKKHGRGLRDGEEDIAPLRQPKRKKHGR